MRVAPLRRRIRPSAYRHIPNRYPARSRESFLPECETLPPVQTARRTVAACRSKQSACHCSIRQQQHEVPVAHARYTRSCNSVKVSCQPQSCRLRSNRRDVGDASSQSSSNNQKALQRPVDPALSNAPRSISRRAKQFVDPAPRRR